MSSVAIASRRFPYALYYVAAASCGVLIAAIFGSDTSSTFLRLAFVGALLTGVAGFVYLPLGFGGVVLLGPLGPGLATGAGLGLAVAILVSEGREHERPGRSVVPYVCVFALVVLVSWVANGLPRDSISGSLTPLAARIAFVLVVWRWGRSVETRTMIVKAVIVSTVIAGSYGLLQSLDVLPTTSETWLRPGLDVARVSGPEGDPNYYALNLAIGCGFAIAALRHRQAVAMSLAALALAVFGIAASLSRTGVLAVAAAILMTAAVDRRKLLAYIGLAVLGCALVVQVFGASLGVRFAELGQSSVGTSTGQRQLLWHGAFELAASHPLVGIGPDQVRNHIAAISSAGLRVPQSAHNTPLDIAADLGVPGLIAWLALVAASVSRTRRFRGHNGIDAAARQAALAGLAAYSAGCLFVTATLSAPFWTTIALVATQPGLISTSRARDGDS